MRKNPSYTALLRPTCLLISEKSATYTIKWSYTIIWQVIVVKVKTIQGQMVQIFVAFLEKLNFTRESGIYLFFYGILKVFERILSEKKMTVEFFRYSSLNSVNKSRFEKSSQNQLFFRIKSGS